MAGVQTFLGFPSAQPGALDGAQIAILGAPHGTPYEPGRISHSADAPTAIRAASQKRAGQWDHHDFDLGGPLLGDLPCRVVDCGDVPGDPADPPGNRAAIAEAVRTVLDAGAVPLLLGGDDSVPIPFIGAYQARGPLWVVQIDAHIDWREERHGERLG